MGIDSTDNASVEDTASEAFCRSINLEGELTYYTHIKQTNKDYKSKVYKFIEQFPRHKSRYDQLVNIFKRGLFNSFLKFIDIEFKKNKSLLVLRTFGKDREFVVEILKDRGMNFVSHTSEELNDKLYRDCYDKGNHIMVQDDYNRWNNGGKTPEVGKRIKHFNGIIQYAFDDNLCMNYDKEVKFYHVNTLRLENDYYISLISEGKYHVL